MTLKTILCEVGRPTTTGEQWVHLFTHGENLARDGRRYVLSDAQGVVSRSLARAGKTSLPIDYEHQTDFARENGKPAPAAGWITRFDVRADGLWALVSWTGAAQAMLTAREYRYISPTFHTTEDGQVVSVLRAALTNNPALELTALATRQTDRTDNGMTLSVEIATALGLPETAGVSEAVAKIAALTASGPDPIATATAMADLVRQLNNAQNSASQRNVTAKVETAIRSGTMPPALREWAVQLCSSDEASFDTFVEKCGTPFAALFVKGTGYAPIHSSNADHSTALASTEETIAAQLGLDRASLKG